LLGGILASLIAHQQLRDSLTRHAGDEVLGSVLAASAHVDGAMEQSLDPGADETPADRRRFAAVRQQLLRVKASHRFSEPGSGVYTLRRAESSSSVAMVQVVVGTEVDPFGRQPAAAPRAAEAFQLSALAGRAGVSEVHHDSRGAWIAAAAPILDASGDVVGALEADRNVDALLAEARRSALAILVASLCLAARGSLGAFWLGRGIERAHAAELQAQAQQSERLLRDAYRRSRIEAGAEPGRASKSSAPPAVVPATVPPVRLAAPAAVPPSVAPAAPAEPHGRAAEPVSASAGYAIAGGLHDGPVRALVVDDVPTNLKVLTRLLTRLGCEVETATDGAEAIERCRSNTYDIILMDCMMPGVDGFEATERIRSIEPPGRHTPIVAVTANVSAEDRQRCITSGMDDHVPKPLKPGVIPEMLARWLPGRQWKEPPREAA
jgi:CheY-like chemotaxis protein